MKKYLLLMFFFIQVNFFSQNIPEIEFNNQMEETNQYVELLKLKEKDALIIKVGYSSHWSKGEYGKYIVFFNNGKVSKYEVYQPTDTKKKTKRRRKRISRKKSKYYWNFLNEIIKNKKYEIDKSRLNITTKKGKGTTIKKVISDGVNYTLGFYQNNKYIIYNSYEPKSFIKDKYPGYKERQKLVDLIEEIEELIRKY